VLNCRVNVAFGFLCAVKREFRVEKRLDLTCDASCQIVKSSSAIVVVRLPHTQHLQNTSKHENSLRVPSHAQLQFSPFVRRIPRSKRAFFHWQSRHPILKLLDGNSGFAEFLDNISLRLFSYNLAKRILSDPTLNIDIMIRDFGSAPTLQCRI